MNGIEKLISRITQDAQKEVADIQAKAEAESRVILDDYGKKAENEYDAAIKRGKIAAHDRIERLSGVAILESKKKTLAIKQKLVSKAFNLALQKLINLPEEESIGFLASLAVEASRTGKEALIFSEADRTRLGKKVVAAANKCLAANGKEAELSLSAETRPICGGLILKDDKIEMNCSYDTLIRIKRDELAGKVSQIIF